MLAIRMQRTGRKGHATFRVIVQDSHRTPTSGNVVASLGNYDPHTKAAVLDKEKTSFYLEHGAQPSERTALLLSREGIKLPKWVIIRKDKKGKPRHEKVAKQPKEQAAEPAASPATEQTEEVVEPKVETTTTDETSTAEATPEQETSPDVPSPETTEETTPPETTNDAEPAEETNQAAPAASDEAPVKEAEAPEQAATDEQPPAEKA